MSNEIFGKIDRIHPYPAKFTYELAEEYISKYTSIGDTVYDPFCGCGTTLLASSTMGRKGFGTDINYIAILISKFKLLKLTDNELYELSIFIEDLKNNFSKYQDDVKRFDYPSINHWFCDSSIVVLSVIKNRIELLSSDNLKTFCYLVLSCIINTVSNQESDTRYAAINKDLSIEKVLSIYIKKFDSVYSLFKEFNNIERDTKNNKVFLCDSKECAKLIPNNSVDLLLTSPPYINTYDYYLYHKHRMNWLGYDVNYSMEKEIGSRREFSSQKHEENKFSDDLYNIFYACNSVIKVGGKVVIVIGDGKVAGNIYDAKYHTEEIATKLNWKLIDYSFSELDKTSKSFQKNFRTQGKKEHVITFVKE